MAGSAQSSISFGSLVGIVKTVSHYPEFPYDPGSDRPEFEAIAKGSNPVTSAVALVLHALGLDVRRFGQRNWNPLAEFVAPGATALIKPNWVMDENPLGDFESLITHTSVIRALIDYLALALDGRGQIVIADAPLQHCDFQRLQRRNRLADLIEVLHGRYPQIELVVENWQITSMRRISTVSTLTGEQTEQFGTEQRYQVIDLGNRSFHSDFDDRSAQFRVTNYDPRLMSDHHRPGRHEYMINRRVFAADLMINVPKLKTHQKAGLTGALKNLVGINGRKEFLPHHTKGAYEDGGDNYLRRSLVQRLKEDLEDWIWQNVRNMPKWKRRVSLQVLHRGLRVLLRGTIQDGAWCGNQTIARTTLDINHVFYCYDYATGIVEREPVRKALHIMDGIVCGEGNGPVEVLPRREGLILGSFNPAALDAAEGVLQGYNIWRVPTLAMALRDARSIFRIEEHMPITVRWTEQSMGGARDIPLDDVAALDFAVPMGWRLARNDSPVRDLYDALAIPASKRRKHESSTGVPNFGAPVS